MFPSCFGGDGWSMLANINSAGSGGAYTRAGECKPCPVGELERELDREPVGEPRGDV